MMYRFVISLFFVALMAQIPVASANSTASACVTQAVEACGRSAATSKSYNQCIRSKMSQCGVKLNNQRLPKQISAQAGREASQAYEKKHYALVKREARGAMQKQPMPLKSGATSGETTNRACACSGICQIVSFWGYDHYVDVSGVNTPNGGICQALVEETCGGMYMGFFYSSECKAQKN